MQKYIASEVQASAEVYFSSDVDAEIARLKSDADLLKAALRRAHKQLLRYSEVDPMAQEIATLIAEAAESKT